MRYLTNFNRKNNSFKSVYMNDQLATNAEALRMFFTEDVYLVKGEAMSVSNTPDDDAPVTVQIPVTEAETPYAMENPVVTQHYTYMGKNQRNILILVNDAQNPVSTEQGRELLRKLVKAIELTANDFALVNYADYTSANYKSLSSYFSSKVMFVFGVTPVQLGLDDIPLNSLVKHENTHLIFSSDLHTLDGDQHGKKTLWGSLKQLTL